MTRVAFHRSRIMIHRAISAETTTPMTVANDPASPAHNFSRSSNLSARCFFADRLTGWRRASGGNNDGCVDVWTSEVQLFFFPCPVRPCRSSLASRQAFGIDMSGETEDGGQLLLVRTIWFSQAAVRVADGAIWVVLPGHPSLSLSLCAPHPTIATLRINSTQLRRR